MDSEPSGSALININQPTCVMNSFSNTILSQLRNAPLPNDVQLLPRGCLHGHEIPLQLPDLSSHSKHLPSAPPSQVFYSTTEYYTDLRCPETTFVVSLLGYGGLGSGTTKIQILPP